MNKIYLIVIFLDSIGDNGFLAFKADSYVESFRRFRLRTKRFLGCSDFRLLKRKRQGFPTSRIPGTGERYFISISPGPGPGQNMVILATTSCFGFNQILLPPDFNDQYTLKRLELKLLPSAVAIELSGD